MTVNNLSRSEVKHNYGLPYKGSKNTIAERIVQCLPSGGRFLDAC